MEEDQLISFETAKLAKEKGFNIKQNIYYLVKADNEFKVINKNSLNMRIDVPTQSLLQKWLREKHKIHIYCTPKYMPDGTLGWDSTIIQSLLNTVNGKHLEKWACVDKDTFEQALEKGLQEALKLIRHENGIKSYK